MEGCGQDSSARIHRTVGLQVHAGALQGIGDLASLKHVWCSQPCFTHGDPEAQRGWDSCSPHTKPWQGCQCVSSLPHPPLAYVLKWEPLLEVEGSPEITGSRPSSAVCARDFLGRQQMAHLGHGPCDPRPRGSRAPNGRDKSLCLILPFSVVGGHLH